MTLLGKPYIILPYYYYMKFLDKRLLKRNFSPAIVILQLINNLFFFEMFYVLRNGSNKSDQDIINL